MVFVDHLAVLGQVRYIVGYRRKMGDGVFVMITTSEIH